MEDNILSSFLRRNPNRKLTMVNEISMGFEREWFQGFSNSIGMKHSEIFPGEYVPFIRPVDGQDNVIDPEIISSEISLNTRFAYNEKFLMGEFERVSLGSKYPILDLDLIFGVKGIWEAEYNYQKIRLNISDKIEVPPAGYLKYSLDLGKIYGDLPYPLLELHKGNETYAFDYFAFNMMNYYEFASDEWASLFVEHHLQGLFLNHIPLLRRLKWREVVSAKGLVGKLSDRHENIMLFPEGMYQVNDPYLEASVGIENIFKIVRIDAMWRMTYLDHPDIQEFGLRAMLQIMF